MSQELVREFDKASLAVLTHKHAGFYGAILAMLDLAWDTSIPTATVSTCQLRINPDFFMSLTPPERKTLVFHEIQHIARLHHSRAAGKNLVIWNIACDIRINNDAKRDGFTPIKGWVEDSAFDMQGDAVEEEIYSKLLAYGSGKGHSDLVNPNGERELDENDQSDVLIVKSAEAVCRAQGGSMPGGITELLGSVKPSVVNWRTYTKNWMEKQIRKVRSLARPKRRYLNRGIILPTYKKDKSKLKKIVWYIDCSGSMSLDEILRAYSEAVHLFYMYKPSEMRFVLFDTIIQKEYVITSSAEVDLTAVGRGGTSFVCVRNDIEQTKPDIAIIFSDMETTPMEPLTTDTDVLWVAVRSSGKKRPSFGNYLSIRGNLV